MKAANGGTVPAMTVFCHALRFFKDHALQEITDQSDTKITNEDVKWVITVPAIWKAPAKQFMRQAAYIVRLKQLERELILLPGYPLFNSVRVSRYPRPLTVKSGFFVLKVNFHILLVSY